MGIYYEHQSQLTYNGQWQDDQRHGLGSLTSQNQQDYVFDGQWLFNSREGKGQLITKTEKYSGLWF